MKRFTKKSIALYVTFAILIVFLTGAQCTIGGCSLTLSAYEAKAVNVKGADSATNFFKDGDSTATLVGAKVMLYAYDAEEGAYEDSPYEIQYVEDDGTFTFYPEANRYKLTGEADDWIFVPQYIEVTNNGSSVKDLLAFPKTGAGVYTVVASWETDGMDVDLLLTYGDEDGTNVIPWDNHTTAATGDRYKIGYSNPGSSAGISHDRDVDGSDPDIPKVETISFHTGAWLQTAADKGTALGDTVKIYLDTAPLTGDTLTGLDYGTSSTPSAYAQVDVVEYNSLNGASTHFGTWYIPWNTEETTIQVIQAEMKSTGLDIASANNAVILNGTDPDDYPTGIRSISGE